MNKLAKGLIAATAAIFLLAGCSAVSAEAQDAPEVSATPSESVEPTAAPITIEEPTATADPTDNWNGFGSQREWFLRSLDGALSGEPPSDDQLIGAGASACEQLKDGAPRNEVRVVKGVGSLADQDNANIVTTAIQVYCPELG